MLLQNLNLLIYYFQRKGNILSLVMFDSLRIFRLALIPFRWYMLKYLLGLQGVPEKWNTLHFFIDRRLVGDLNCKSEQENKIELIKLSYSIFQLLQDFAYLHFLRCIWSSFTMLNFSFNYNSLNFTVTCITVFLMILLQRKGKIHLDNLKGRREKRNITF